MTFEELPSDPARGLRRLMLVGLLLALAGAGAALGISASHHGSRGPSIFPATFSEAGFVTGSVRLSHSYEADAGDRKLSGDLPAGAAVYLVARCDHGGMIIAVGATNTSKPCTGRPVGVIVLQAPRTVKLTATVTAPQSTTWGLAIYR